MQPKLSLIIATMGRTEELERLLNSLSFQTATRFEAIVVDQSNCDTQPEIERLTQTYANRFPVLYVRDEGRGLSRARNLGLKYVTGEYIGFPDDDCWYPAQVVEQVTSFFDSNENYGILSGCYTEPGVQNPDFPSKAVSLTPWNLFGRASSVGIFLHSGIIGKSDICFDEHIGAGTAIPAGEETDLLLRLLLRGIKGLYEPNLVVFHKICRDKVTTLPQFIAHRKAFWYVIGKNYSPWYSEVKLIRGLAVCLVKKQAYGLGVQFRTVVSGYRDGVRSRQRLLRK